MCYDFVNLRVCVCVPVLCRVVSVKQRLKERRKE